ncbi:ATP-binding cassette transporter [Penicillium verhagenii]|nr:ATP-binding cassette transporter [Penicillium verhagenii]
MACPRSSDMRFGPRIDPSCRSFDFTLLFEDAFFSLLPAALFLVLIPPRLRVLWRVPTKLRSYRLAILKFVTFLITSDRVDNQWLTRSLFQSILFGLIIVHVLYTAFRVENPALHTSLGMPSGMINIAATVAAVCLSFLEDQRSVRPSDILVLYYSASTLLSLPQIRSLWQIPDSTMACRIPCIMILILNFGMLVAESIHKLNFLNPNHQRKSAREATYGFWGQSLFLWTLALFQTGYSKALTIEDIPEVDVDQQAQRTEEVLQIAWTATKGRHRLMKSVFSAYRWTLVFGVVPRLCLAVFTFCQPFLINTTVNYMNEDATVDTKQRGQGIIGAYVLVYLGIAVSNSVYKRQLNRFSTMTRSGLISLIFTQTTQLKASDVVDSAALTHMGTDTERIVSNLRSIHEIWATVLEVGVAVWLLKRQVNVSCVVPGVITIGSVLAVAPLSSRMGQAQGQWVERVQSRISMTSNLLRDIKSVKMLGLSGVMYKTITKLREAELKTSERFRKLLIGEIALSNVPATFAPFATFTVYGIIAAVSKDKTLLSSQAFTSLSLITLVTNPLLKFIQSVPSLKEAMACFDRIEDYLLKPIAHSRHIAGFYDESNQEAIELVVSPSKRNDGIVIAFENADIAWSKEGDHHLHDVNLSVRQGEITMVIGPVASGKSTILQTVLHETVVKAGEVKVTTSESQIAYCAQVPWIINASVRDNIILGSEYNSEWYEFSISVCGLKADLQKMPGGDSFEAGSNGVCLSGGQKQRIALCRAIYSRAKLLFLDDIFSGVDAHNVSLISNGLFSQGGHLRSAGITVLLATHTEPLLQFADEIIVLENGRVIDTGSYESIIRRGPDISARAWTNASGIVEEDASTEQESKDKKEPNTAPSASPSTSGAADHNKRNGSWSVYKYYYESAGFTPFAVFISFTLAEAFCSNFTTMWLKWWVEANEQRPNKDLAMYLGVYALLWVLAFTTLIGSLWALIISIINNTGLNLHTYILRTTLRAPFIFLQTTDHGSLTNRFSQDMDLIDMALPLYASMFSAGIANCAVQVVILCVLSNYLAVSIPLLIVSLMILQRYYLRTSRQMRLLDIEAKAPLYSHFAESVQGISTIRAFNFESDFKQKMYHLLNRSQRPFYMLYCIQQWLTLVMNLTVGAIALIIVSMATSLRSQYTGVAIGVALNLVLSLNDSLSNTLQCWVSLETCIGAVSRVQQFTRDTPYETENDLNDSHFIGSPLYPDTRYTIKFEGLTAGYDLSSPPALKNISITFAPGQKIAICGASGSGKTSLIMSILRMNQIRSGSLRINGRDLAGFTHQEIHALMNIIPQDPLIISPGTVRFNIDPLNLASDKDIESALQKVGLWNRVNANGSDNNGEGQTDTTNVLSADLSTASTNWSAGEKQLFALARPLAVPKPILILDEATSSMDGETESIMQQLFENEFREQTVLAVLHRFKYIHLFDLVAVLKDGVLVECDKPESLLGQDSDFRRLYSALDFE